MWQTTLVGVGTGAVVTVIATLGIATPAVAMHTVAHAPPRSASEEVAGPTPSMCPPANLDHRADYREQPGGPSSRCPADLPADPDAVCPSVYRPCLGLPVLDVPHPPAHDPPTPGNDFEWDLIQLAVGALGGLALAWAAGIVDSRHHPTNRH
jgi:hypothetical protein